MSITGADLTRLRQYMTAVSVWFRLATGFPLWWALAVCAVVFFWSEMLGS